MHELTRRAALTVGMTGLGYVAASHAQSDDKAKDKEGPVKPQLPITSVRVGGMVISTHELEDSSEDRPLHYWTTPFKEDLTAKYVKDSVIAVITGFKAEYSDKDVVMGKEKQVSFHVNHVEVRVKVAEQHSDLHSVRLEYACELNDVAHDKKKFKGKLFITLFAQIAR